MRVLVTRPEPDGLKLKGLLEERGYEAEVAPLMSAAFDNCDEVDLEGITALIATSRNALRALRGQLAAEGARALRLYAVGAGTAEEARRLGFGTIIKGPGTVGALIPIIASTLDPMEEMLLHLRGDRVTLDVRAELEAQGFRVAEAIVYRMRAAQQFQPAVVDQLNDGEIDAVMLMSPQTAAIYARLVAKHRLEVAVRRIAHLCVSDSVANRLTSLGNIPVEVAEAPTIEEMLALVDLAAAQSDM